MTQFTVIGAGMAGLLAAAMLRDECTQVLEAQAKLPNNHSALLRFKTSLVGDTLNIPFQRVKVMKAVVGHSGNPVGDALAYSLKTNGTATLRSSTTAHGEIEERFIAPGDLIAQMARKVTCPIEFGRKWEGPRYKDVPGAKMIEPFISTLPMPVLMQLLDYPDIPEFRYAPGFTMSVKLKNVNACATLYFSDPAVPFYRASITRDRLIVEYSVPAGADLETTMRPLADYPKMQRDEIVAVLQHFGLTPSANMIANSADGKPEVKPVAYAKVLPIDDRERKRFIMWASETHNIYSLGRFATWRPSLLMDDVVNDVRVIQKIAREGNYEHKK